MPRIFGRSCSAALSALMVTLALAPIGAHAGAQTDIAVAAGPGSVAVADFNHDGIPDLAVGSSNALSILLGVGDGTFSTKLVLSLASPVNPVVGDFNGDGNPDLAMGSGLLLLGVGDGTFQARSGGFGSASTTGMAAGDLNGDGKLDLVVASFGQTVVYLGNGDGTFHSGTTYPYGWYPTRLADLNRDGRLDLITADATSLLVLLGNGDGTFGSPLPRFTSSNDAVVGDLNGDGIPDIVSLGSGCVSIALGRGDGTFIVSGVCGMVGSPIALGDLDGDGHLDIFSGKYGSTWLKGKGDGTFGPPTAVAVGAPDSYHFAAIADLNRDGHDDIVLTNSTTNSVSVLLGPVGPPALGSASFSPSSLSFGSLSVWRSSAPQTVTLTSTGPGALVLGGWTWDPGFKVTSSCPLFGLLAVGLSCTYTIDFEPDRVGAFAGALIVTDSDLLSQSRISLTGTGLVNPSSITVDPVTTAVGTPANFRALVTSNGQPPLVGGQVLFTLPNGATFSSFVGRDGVAGYGGYNTSAFTPGFYPNGIRADFQGGSGYAASTGFADLTVTSVPTAPAVTLSPAPLDFGNVAVGSTAHGLILISNTGNGLYNFAGATVTGDFSIPQINCSGPIAPGNSCGVYVDFKPTLGGPRAGTMTVNGNDPTSPDSAALTGVGLRPELSLQPGSVDFGNVLVKTTSNSVVTATNTGNAPLQLNGATITGGDGTSFRVALDGCGNQLLAPGASCGISISFSNATQGSFSAVLTVYDAVGAPHLVALAARATAPVVSLGPNPLDFGNVNGGTTGHGLVTLTNVGDAPYHFGGATTTGDFQMAQSTCSAAVAPAGTCSISIDFTPTAPGVRGGGLTIVGDDVGSPGNVGLSGVGLMPLAQLSVTALSYAARNAGTTSAPQSVLVSNSGNSPLNISGVTVVGPNAADFRIVSNSCASPVSAGASCSVGVAFLPSSYGSRTATLQVVDNAPDAIQRIALSGSGVAASLSTTPAALDFGGKRVGQATAGTVLTLTNRGNAPLHGTSVTITGSNPKDFGITAIACPTTLASGSSCNITIRFKPTALGTRSAVLRFVTNGVPSVVSVALTGTGSRG